MVESWSVKVHSLPTVKRFLVDAAALEPSMVHVWLKIMRNRNYCRNTKPDSNLPWPEL